MWPSARKAGGDGLQQNEENRSNLALVNTGEADGSESVFRLEIYDGETGMLVRTVVTRPVPARGWHQINGIFGSDAPEPRQEYIRILKVSGQIAHLDPKPARLIFHFIVTATVRFSMDTQPSFWAIEREWAMSSRCLPPGSDGPARTGVRSRADRGGSVQSPCKGEDR